MDVGLVREQFPILKDIIYLDSASTSLTPEPVIEAVADYYRSYRANVGRGVYRTAQIADQRYREAHRKAAALIGCAAAGGEGLEQGTTVFTRNATESINMVARGIRWKRGERIITTLTEHHSNLLPWMRLRESGVELQIVKPDRNGLLDLGQFERAAAKGARLVAVSHLSNALGTVQPVEEISNICRDCGAPLLLDAAQSVPHMPLSVQDIGCDYLCFSGHKMLGPTGSGVLWMRGGDGIEPLLAGGGMVEDVAEQAGSFSIKQGYEGYEAGTPDIAAGIGLGAAIDYLQHLGLEAIHSHELGLTKRLVCGLEDISGVTVYGPRADEGGLARGGVVSFNVEGFLPHEVALMLDQAADISVRSGHHCCIPLMRHLGLKHGTVRASLYLYNTADEIDRLLAAVEQIAGMAGR